MHKRIITYANISISVSICFFFDGDYVLCCANSFFCCANFGDYVEEWILIFMKRILRIMGN